MTSSRQPLIGLAALFALPLCRLVGLAHLESPQEQAARKLEDAYRRNVKAADLFRYNSLGQPDFFGWPYFSAVPQRKAHVADWVTDFNRRGLTLKSFTLKPSASQATDSVVITYYSLTARWVDRQGHGQPATTRVTHTWIHSSAGWQILGGMSASVATAPSP